MPPTDSLALVQVHRIHGCRRAQVLSFLTPYEARTVTDHPVLLRTLLYGGIFGYPSDKKSKDGKLRLLYEGFPSRSSCMTLLSAAASGADMHIAHHSGFPD